MKNTLEFLIIENRIKKFGKDTNFSYSYQEYQTAFDELVNMRFGLLRNFHLGWMAISAILAILTSDTKIFTISVGVFITNYISYYNFNSLMI